MRSAPQDTIRGGIDRIAGRALEAFGRLTGNRSAVAKGKAARGRGAGRSAKGRLARRGR
ncbi:MAG: CsbD family protein [Solirubrobacterales bacterium]|nr:CsbD family protein [Solirubrobacterales bacterium]